MKPSQFEEWKNEILREVFIATAASESLRAALIFKGARVLNELMQVERVSLDLDSNLSVEFSLEVTDLQKQNAFLQQQFEEALNQHFRKQKVVRFVVESVRITSKPHPHGWNAHDVRIKVRDAQNATVLGLPAIEIDIAAPERLSAHAVGELKVGAYTVRAYTLERIAGEKLRAFLSTLPAYRLKMKKPGEAIRVKDLYDLGRIHRAHSTRDHLFWRKAGEDFRLACESRFIDCLGLPTFQENWPAVKAAFEKNPTLPKNLLFDEAEAALQSIIGFLETERFLPFEFPLP